MKEDFAMVDHSSLRTNQTFIILLLIAAFVLNSPLIAAFVAAVMLVGTLLPKAGLFKLVYEKGLRPLGLLKPDVKEESPRPHLFAQGFGGVFLSVGVLALLLGAAVVGWTLVWVVVALAALNLFAGFCAGCFLYFQLGRFGVPGFGG